MSDYTQSLSVNSQSAALLHTLQRHRDILQVRYEGTKTFQRDGFSKNEVVDLHKFGAVRNGLYSSNL